MRALNAYTDSTTEWSSVFFAGGLVGSAVALALVVLSFGIMALAHKDEFHIFRLGQALWKTSMTSFGCSVGFIVVGLLLNIVG